MGGATVDFWWLKPRADNKDALEEKTLNRHAKGTHKNDPGASKKVYLPIAALFSKASNDGKLRFGLAPAPPALLPPNGDGVPRPRAYIDCLTSNVRYFVCWVWQEDWASPVSLGKKWMKGKIIYQREDQPSAFFARPFRFVDGGGLQLPIGAGSEERVDAVLPSDVIKLNCTA